MITREWLLNEIKFYNRSTSEGAVLERTLMHLALKGLEADKLIAALREIEDLPPLRERERRTIARKALEGFAKELL